MHLTQEEFDKRYDALPEGVADVVDDTMRLLEAMDSLGEAITINTLSDGFALALDKGHKRAEILLTMLMVAIRKAGSRKGDG